MAGTEEFRAESTIGERIRRLRKGALMTQDDLAATADVSTDLIRKLEQGQRHAVTTAKQLEPIGQASVAQWSVDGCVLLRGATSAARQGRPGAATDLLTEPRLYPPRQYVTLCGQVITDMDLPHATCPDDECDCELRYCPTCLQYATGWNAEIEGEMQAPGWTARVGFDGESDAPAGVIARLGSSSAPGGAPAPQRP
jgi:transcriptional regulator with XRE-family HTH domain